jgi:large subunit ribosomal protein L3
MSKRPGLLGRKIGMTQIFDEEGDVVPVTVVATGPCSVIQVKTQDINGYSALQLGFEERKEKHTTKGELGHFHKAGLAPKRFVREIRLENDPTEEAGSQLTVSDIFEGVKKVDVTGISKGCGFSGVMKRHNFKGFIRTHGTHEFFRHGGSIGCRLTPGRVFLGKAMPGQMGNQRVTVQNLTIAKIDAEQNLLFIKGGLPGKNGGYLVIRHAVKLHS